MVGVRRGARNGGLHHSDEQIVGIGPAGPDPWPEQCGLAESAGIDTGEVRFLVDNPIDHRVGASLAEGLAPSRGEGDRGRP